MSKFEKFLTGLKKSQEVLDALDESGIDVNRLIGISNAQGNVANLVRGVLSMATDTMDDASQNHGRQAVKKALKPAPNRKMKK